MSCLAPSLAHDMRLGKEGKSRSFNLASTFAMMINYYISFFPGILKGIQTRITLKIQLHFDEKKISTLWI